MNESFKLKKMIDKESIHKRLLDLKTYSVDEDHIIVEGHLKDNRVQTTYDFYGKIQKPGIIHNMIIRILVGGMPLSILDAEAEMATVPNELCSSTLDSIKEIIGLKIKGGFGENVHRRIGGVKGCVHLTHLIVTMGQEAVHGAWINEMMRKTPDQEFYIDAESEGLLINSCSLWRKDGPLVKEFAEFFKKRER